MLTFFPTSIKVVSLRFQKFDKGKSSLLYSAYLENSDGLKFIS
ncbi:MAG TPA: hypothetical protein PLQ72_00025 [Candidatus Pacearchaeota archaeon]|nr:hypothetical protein [Candidatus Pacearchaeota archaeon]